MDAKYIFEILTRENAAMLLAFLRSSIRDPNNVDDLFQETMLVAWRRLDEFDRAFGPWLRGIAGKLVLAHYREHARGALTLDPSALEWLESRFANLQNQPGDSFAEKLSALRDCVDSLPENYRDPIRMKYLDEMSLDKVGTTLSIALETLKKRLTRAKQRLADCLDRKIHPAEQPS